MKLIYAIVILGLISCANQHNDNLKTNNDSTDCPTKQFEKTYGYFKVQAIYADCESDWKYNLKILRAGKIIFIADSLMEFEFKSSSWPNYVKIGDDTTQFLLEVNDRPLINYILCLTIAKDKVMHQERFPVFVNKPKDFDNDGAMEYSGFSYTSEGYSNDSCYYNPLIFVEQSQRGFQIDIELVKSVNSRIYGGFYGMEVNENIKLKILPIDSLKNILN